MKLKFFVLILLILFAFGCTTVRWTIGMPESDFKSQSRQIKVVEMSAAGTVYKFYSEDGNIYFYFTDGKLRQVDHGERVPDVTIQVKN